MTWMPETAMVLAAGLGTRMRPLTDEMPKPLIKVAGKPLIDYALDRFAAAGVSRAIVNVHYFAEKLERHLLGRATPAVAISDERGELLETGGGLKKARALLGDEPVFCTNTDAILIDGPGEEACRRLAAEFDAGGADAVLLLAPRERASGYGGRGDFRLDEAGALVFRERDGEAPFVYTGLQIIRPQLVDDGPDGPFSLRLAWGRAIDRGGFRGVVHDGDWLHVGDPEGLAVAEARLAAEPKTG